MSKLILSNNNNNKKAVSFAPAKGKVPKIICVIICTKYLICSAFVGYAQWSVLHEFCFSKRPYNVR